MGKEKIKESEIEVEMGTLKRTGKYKFHGNWTGKPTAKIKERERKGNNKLHGQLRRRYGITL